MEVQVNMMAVLLATLSSFVVGMIWYSKPVFGPVWQKLVKLDDKQVKDGMGKAVVMTIVPAFLAAYVLAHVTFLSNYFFSQTGTSWLSSALQTAFWVWLGFAATTVVKQNAFEQRRKKLTLISVANLLVTFLVMGLIIGYMKPAGV